MTMQEAIVCDQCAKSFIWGIDLDFMEVKRMRDNVNGAPLHFCDSNCAQRYLAGCLIRDEVPGRWRIMFRNTALEHDTYLNPPSIRERATKRQLTETELRAVYEGRVLVLGADPDVPQNALTATEKPATSAAAITPLTDDPLKEGLSDAPNYWKPVPGYGDLEMNTYYNPPPLRNIASHEPVPTLDELRIWDFLRARGTISSAS